MRCLSLAEELRNRRARVCFVCREHHGNVMDLIESRGFEVFRLPLPSGLSSDVDAGGLGDLPTADARDCAKLIEDVTPDWVVVDHYGAAGAWDDEIARLHIPVMAIDDFERPRNVTRIHDQNLRPPGQESPRPSRKGDLLGPRFALLGPAFFQIRRSLVRQGSSRLRILVFFGGSDLTDETSKALGALSLEANRSFEVDVVLGRNHPDKARVSSLAVQRPGTTVHEDLPSLAALMTRADLAIGAGGSTTWERLCLGLPAAVTILAANQAPGSLLLAEMGRVVLVGHAESTTTLSYAVAIAKLRSLSPLQDDLVDGLGAHRVAEVLCPTADEQVYLRDACIGDARCLFDWRQDPDVRAMSMSAESFTWGSHVEWLRARLGSTETLLLLAILGELPVGQVRFDHRDSYLLLSYSLDPVVRGRRLSYRMLAAALKRAGGRWPGLPVHAVVRTENAPSRRVFERLGWQVVGADGGSVTYGLDPGN